MTRIFAALALALPMTALNTPAVASQAVGRVANITVRASDGLHYVSLQTTLQGRPACTGASDYFMIKNEGSDAGRAQLAMLMSARLSGQKVLIVGTGTCTRGGDGEDIETVSIMAAN